MEPEQSDDWRVGTERVQGIRGRHGGAGVRRDLDEPAGNSSNPPATIPEFMAVIVSSSVQRNGAVITGNVKGIIIVKTEPGYGPAPGHRGNGRVVAVLCTP